MRSNMKNWTYSALSKSHFPQFELFQRWSQRPLGAIFLLHFYLFLREEYIIFSVHVMAVKWISQYYVFLEWYVTIVCLTMLFHCSQLFDSCLERARQRSKPTAWTFSCSWNFLSSIPEITIYLWAVLALCMASTRQKHFILIFRAKHSVGACISSVNTTIVFLFFLSCFS